MTRIIVLIISIIAASHMGLTAQRTLSLEECIKIAQDNSIKIKQAFLSKKNTEIQEKFARQQLLPSLSANSTLSYHLGRSIDPTTNTYLAQSFMSQGINLNTGFTIYNGTKLRNSIKQAITNRQASEEEIQQMKRDIALLVANTYLAILYTNENISNAHSQYNATKEQLDKMNKLIEAGLKAPASSLNLEAQLLADEQKIITYQNELDKNYLNLKNLLLLDDKENIKIIIPKLGIDDYTASEINSYNELYNAAMQHYPAYQASQYKIKSAILQKKIAQGSLLPSLNIYAGLSTNYADKAKKFSFEPTIKYQNFIIDGEQKKVGIPSVKTTVLDYPYMSQLEDNLGIGLSLQLNIPIYSKYAYRAQIQNAKIKIESEKLSQELIVQDLKTKIQNAIADKRAAKMQYKAAGKTYEARHTAFENTKKQFESGTISSYDYINSRALLEQAQNNMTLAKYQYIFKSIILDFYLGKNIKL